MLVLSRRVGERVRIGDDIELVVVEVKGDVVRLGIEAPRGVAIYRQELYEAISRENLAAGQTPHEITGLKGLLANRPKAEK
jgi:carbon storage regulator